MPASDDIQLSERARAVLSGLIHRYIDDGIPVGSRTLAKETNLSLSSATIRNVMADLEDLELIQAPHTSAGRIPTVKGYRFFINGILKVGPMNIRSFGKISKRLGSVSDPNSILTSATEMLSQITSFAGIVSTPDNRQAHFRHIEFIKLSDLRVLAILVTDDGQVQNKVLWAHREYSESELIEATNYFNSEYSAMTLEGVRAQLILHMKQDRKSMHREMRTAVKMAGQLFDGDIHISETVLVRGENNLLSIPGFSELDKLKALFDAFKAKQVLFDLLQKSMFSGGVNIFIGEESGYEPFQDCSVISAPYVVDNRRVGVLGVIGPTRMQYEEVISTVDVTAKLLGSALSAHTPRTQ